MTYFLIMTALLAALLFFPISKFVWVMSVRRFEKKAKRKLEEGEIQGQLQRARFIAAFVSLLFAALFQYNIFGISS